MEKGNLKIFISFSWYYFAFNSFGISFLLQDDKAHLK